MPAVRLQIPQVPEEIDLDAWPSQDQAKGADDVWLESDLNSAVPDAKGSFRTANGEMDLAEEGSNSELDRIFI